MYIHIGGGNVLRKKSIIGIFDLDTATIARQTKIFLREKEAGGSLVYSSHNLPRSFFLCDDRVVISDLNTRTARARMERVPGKERTDNGTNQ